MDFEVGDILEVKWIDSCYSGSWEELEESLERPDETDCKSVGHYLKHTEELLWLNPDVGGTGDGCRTTRTIPRSCIKNIRKL